MRTILLHRSLLALDHMSEMYHRQTADAAAAECDDPVSRESFPREQDHVLLIGDKMDRDGSASPRIWRRWLAVAPGHSCSQ